MHTWRIALLAFMAIEACAADLSAVHVQPSATTPDDDCSSGADNRSSSQCLVSLIQKRAHALSVAPQIQAGCQAWTFRVNPVNGDLVGILKGPKTGSGQTEVHIMSKSSNYNTYSLQTGTALGYTTSGTWDFAMMPNGDLMGIYMGPTTGSGKTEVHIMSASSNYQEFSLATPTALGYTTPETWDFEVMSNGDLMGIYKGPSTGSGKTEVHTMSASSNYQQFSLATPTALGMTTSGNWQFGVMPNGDLMGIYMGPSTGSGMTEVHTMSASSNYGQFSLATPTAQGMTDPADWDFLTPNGNLMGVLKGPSTGSGMTEVHEMTQSSNYGQYSLNIATVQGLTVGPSVCPQTPAPTPPPTTTPGPTPGPSPAPATTPAPTPGPSPAPATTPAPTPAPTPGTCTVYGDPHIKTFDSGHNSNFVYMKRGDGHTADYGDFWLVKNKDVHIQGRYMSQFVEGKTGTVMTWVAVGGPFLQNHRLIIGPEQGEANWWTGNEKKHLRWSEWNTNGGGVFKADGLISAKYSNETENVEHPTQHTHGVQVDLPLNVRLTINRFPHLIALKIVAPKLPGGQDGQCGNFNGIAADDTAELIAQRMGASVVAPKDLIFPFPLSHYAA